MDFELVASAGSARAGTLRTARGEVSTPVFMPVATQAAAKALTARQLAESGASLVLGNTYHLHLRPGDEMIRDLGGIHRFMGWPGPMLTDSGGFQVFSLASQCRVDDQGVSFRSHIDGAAVHLTPQRAIAIQERLGADLIMPLDHCLGADADFEAHRDAVERTHRWAVRCRETHSREDQTLLAIVQGGIFADLRAQSARRLAAEGFPGYAVGGLSVGESQKDMLRALEAALAELPADKPRYLMGVGYPWDLVEAIARGVDMFDCVLPSRHARHGEAYTFAGMLRLKHAKHRAADQPLEPDCPCDTCRTHSRAYLRHLVLAKEYLAGTLLTLHNQRFYQRLTAACREAIIAGRFFTFADELRASWARQASEHPTPDA